MSLSPYLNLRHCDTHQNQWSGDAGCIMKGCRRSKAGPVPYPQGDIQSWRRREAA